jgi:hypothetical protein
MRLPFDGFRPDHSAGVEPAAIDAHRAAEPAADFQGRRDDGVTREARPNGFEYVSFRGGLPRSFRSSSLVRAWRES